jgi:cobalt-precorrin 5A hydrolase
MRASVFTFTRSGTLRGEQLLEFLKGEGFEAVCYAMKDYASDSNQMIPMDAGLKAAVGTEFGRCRLLIFIGALGIAVRAIAPFIYDKAKDPAVICMDETAKFVIPVLSGHIGGANAFAGKIAGIFDASAAVTTATDVNGVFAADEWASEQGLVITDIAQVKQVSKELLDGGAVGLHTDYEIKGDLPFGITVDLHCKTGIAVSPNGKVRPFENTLNLLPRILHLGIGCKKDTKLKDINKAVTEILDENDIDIRCICNIASIDLKENEAGLLSFADYYCLPVSFYTAEELSKAEGFFTKSDFVKSVTSVDNVCERAAALSSGGGRLIIQKTAKNGVTVAVAEPPDWSICFED